MVYVYTSIFKYLKALPITVTARSESWTVFARSNTGVVGSNPTQDMDACVRLLCVCAIMCVGSDLWRADPHSRGSAQCV
jgi:hypothetical protein